MSILKDVLIRVSGNRIVQDLLETNVRISQYLRGIGAGAGVRSSGEHAIFQVLRQRNQPPYCIFDVGSNKGQFLQLIIENVAPDDFKVHCFEPGLETFNTLLRVSQSDQRVILNNIGLGKEKGAVLLHYDNVGSGLASLTKRHLEHFNIEFGKSEMVAIDTIDNYCSTTSIAHIHLLKIDIEGHELDALTGARRMFDQRAIDMVSFEFGGCNIDTRTFFRDFWYFFSEVGFMIFRITCSGYLHPVHCYQELHEQFRTTNFLAIATNSRNSRLGGVVC